VVRTRMLQGVAPEVSEKVTRDTARPDKTADPPDSSAQMDETVKEGSSPQGLGYSVTVAIQ
jgi:hypothetical protein